MMKIAECYNITLLFKENEYKGLHLKSPVCLIDCDGQLIITLTPWDQVSSSKILIHYNTKKTGCAYSRVRPFL